MCQVELIICRHHNAIRAYTIERCPDAIVATGRPKYSGPTHVNEMPRTLKEVAGCSTEPTLNPYVAYAYGCVPPVPGGLSACQQMYVRQ